MKIGPCVCNVKQLDRHVIAAGYNGVTPNVLYEIGKFTPSIYVIVHIF